MSDKKELQPYVEEVLNTIFNFIGIEVECTYTEPEEKEYTKLLVDISSPEANVLIGYHGDTLQSLQHLVNVMVYSKFETNAGVLIDIEGYRKQREDKLREIAENASSKARFLDKSVALYPMNSYERRIVHEEVAQIDGVTSESEGEGSSRRVVISPE